MQKIIFIFILMGSYLSYAGWYEGSDGKTYYMPSNLLSLERLFEQDNPKPGFDDPSYVSWLESKEKYLIKQVKEEMKETQPSNLSDTGIVEYKEGFGFVYEEPKSISGLANARGLRNNDAGILTVNQALDRSGGSGSSRQGPPVAKGNQANSNNSAKSNENSRAPASGTSANSINATSLDSSGASSVVGGMCSQDKLLNLGIEHQETIRAAKAVLNRKLVELNCDLYQ